MKVLGIGLIFLSFRAIKVKSTNGKKKKGFHQSDGLPCAPVVNDFDIRKKERKEWTREIKKELSDRKS